MRLNDLDLWQGEFAGRLIKISYRNATAQTACFDEGKQICAVCFVKSQVKMLLQ
ncbi:hypothetical protein FRUB_02029 [Fimbriiglobus ruber]|uniref:Uncharacterized protein n=1 Tax=Fimbriiglobus ruber TaxID=1908690 RepID=A0A225E4H1_9BACT|nr:hypothetical protein FRUB_02029 [Fimbriiglobus ruber]